MIDWSRVRELFDEIGADDFEEVVTLFMEEVEEVVERLKTNPGDADLEQDLHFLKGSGASFGFVNFSALCQAGEKESASGRAGTVNIGHLVSEYYLEKDLFLKEMPQKLCN